MPRDVVREVTHQAVGDQRRREPQTTGAGCHHGVTSCGKLSQAKSAKCYFAAASYARAASSSESNRPICMNRPFTWIYALQRPRLGSKQTPLNLDVWAAGRRLRAFSAAVHSRRFDLRLFRPFPSLWSTGPARPSTPNNKRCIDSRRSRLFSADGLATAYHTLLSRTANHV